MTDTAQGPSPVSRMPPALLPHKPFFLVAPSAQRQEDRSATLNDSELILDFGT